MTMITPSYLGETIEYSSLHACRSTLEDPTMSKVQVIESELGKLSTKEMRRIRDWLDDQLDGSSRRDQDIASLRDDVAAGVRQVRSRRLKSFDDAAVIRIKSRGRKLLASAE